MIDFVHDDVLNWAKHYRGPKLNVCFPNDNKIVSFGFGEFGLFDIVGNISLLR